ncbi:MAG: hypothetical protein JHC67_07930 [Mycolicibacterium sp.]|nr:hypothetical protein [Mycolicibacterium sp.]
MCAVARPPRLSRRQAFTPTDGATGIIPTVAVGPRVSDGWFQRIALTNPAGEAVTGSIATVAPTRKVTGGFQLSDGQTVSTDPITEGGWAWLPDEAQGSRLHWRSREYFEPGTRVHVGARLYGVAFGDGDYGEADQPRNVTRSGIHVVTEKYSDFYMSNPAAGYNRIHERWAVRISDNGEFIHANGCINLSTDDAEQYFYSALYGDPVEVTGTSIQLSYTDGDIWDWAVDWYEWTSMSALSTLAQTSTLPSSTPVTPTDAPTRSGTRPGG